MVLPYVGIYVSASIAKLKFKISALMEIKVSNKWKMQFLSFTPVNSPKLLRVHLQTFPSN